MLTFHETCSWLYIFRQEQNSLSQDIYRLQVFALLALRRPEEHREEKLNHFNPPGQGRSLTEQCNVTVTGKIPICLTLDRFAPLNYTVSKVSPKYL